MLAAAIPATAHLRRDVAMVAPTAPYCSGDALTDRVSMSPVRRLAPKEHLFLEGDARTHVYVVEAGTVLIYKILPDAKRQIIDIAFPGDFIGLGTADEQAFAAQATEPVRVRCLPAAALHQLAADDPQLSLMLYEALALELEAARNHLLTIGYRSAAARVASFLLAISHRNERRGRDARELVLPMRRADIADFLGLTIETVSRTFSKLKAEGMIELDHGGYVEILDRRALKEIAEGEGKRG
jgi:CRP/FNR family transcriptional regulator